MGWVSSKRKEELSTISSPISGLGENKIAQKILQTAKKWLSEMSEIWTSQMDLWKPKEEKIPWKKKKIPILSKC